jgi:hypothetical protein
MVALVAGVTPAVLLVELPVLIPIFLVEAAVIAVLALRGFATSSTEQPTFLEFLLAADCHVSATDLRQAGGRSALS